MSCDWTEQISALIDGELAAADARAAERHLEGCTECRQARDGFLLLRRQVNSYGETHDPATQRRVLAAVLASKSGTTRANDMRARERREPARVRGLAAGLFGGRGLSAAAAALAVIFAAVAVGILAYVTSRDDASKVGEVAREAAPAKRSGDADVAGPARIPPDATPSPGVEKRNKNVAGSVPDRKQRRQEIAVRRKTPGSIRRLNPRRPRTEDAPVPDAVAQGTGPESGNPRGLQPAAATAAPAPPPAATAARLKTRTGALDAARHAEQAQMLLRSFRNARLANDDLAYERERSRKLLYRNIVLRREAAARRDPVVAQALDRLEPILIDIANLPDEPAAEEVNLIRERMRNKNIVVLLQASAATRRKSY